MASVLAVIVAVRGTARSRRDIPDSLATPAPPHETPILEDVELSGGDGIDGIPGSPCGKRTPLIGGV